MIWTLKQITAAVEGVLISEHPAPDEVRFQKVATDSRQVTPHSCYVALKGQKFDGHDFIADAVEQGASVLLVAKPILTSVPAVLVEDTRIALGRFAAWHRLQCPLKTLFAVTGSNGKTTSKAMLHSVLSHLGATLATEGNLNNDYGVPRTLLNMTETHEYAVIEMGANHLGEIRYLTQLAQPDIALITQASEVHLEGFGSLQGVIDTKGEIFEGLRQGGTAIINLDSAGSEQWLTKCQQAGQKVMTFGKHKQANIRLMQVVQTAQGLGIQMQLPDAQLVAFSLSVLGPHNAMNAAGVTAACWAAGLKWPQILPGLVSFKPVSGRLNTFELKQGTLIDDSYNANPTSVKAGIDTLLAIAGESMVCLGSMAELGSSSLAFHQSVVDYALSSKVAHIFVMGAGYQACELSAPSIRWFESHEAMLLAAQALLDQAHSTSMHLNILVKGSRSAGMEVVSQKLISVNSLAQSA